MLKSGAPPARRSAEGAVSTCSGDASEKSEARRVSSDSYPGAPDPGFESAAGVEEGAGVGRVGRRQFPRGIERAREGGVGGEALGGLVGARRCACGLAAEARVGRAVGGAIGTGWSGSMASLPGSDRRRGFVFGRLRFGRAGEGAGLPADPEDRFAVRGDREPEDRFRVARASRPSLPRPAARRARRRSSRRRFRAAGSRRRESAPCFPR